MTAGNNLLEAIICPFTSDKGIYVFERQVRGAAMNDQERGQFVQKAKVDRMAYEAAELLSQGEPGKAATLIGDSFTPASKNHFTTWFRHYATTRFKVAGTAVDKFLVGIEPADVAL